MQVQKARHTIHLLSGGPGLTVVEWVLPSAGVDSEILVDDTVVVGGVVVVVEFGDSTT